MEKLNVSKGTIVRTIMLVFVIINMALKAAGHDILIVEESEVAKLVELGIEVAVILVSFWKNNSFTKAAIEADQLMAHWKHSDGTEKGEEND